MPFIHCNLLEQNMRKSVFVACVLVIFAPLTASAEIIENHLGIEKGSVDLPKNEALAKPFTVLDQLLYSLKLEAMRASKFFNPENDDFRLLKYSDDHPQVDVQYTKDQRRVGISFELSVQGMDDPWEQVCERHIRKMTQILVLEEAGSIRDKPSFNDRDTLAYRRVFLQGLLGQVLIEDEAKVISLQPFIDAIVVIGKFSVWKDGKFSYRHCARDIKSKKMTYFESKH